MLAVSNVLWLGGEVVWSVLELGLGREAPFPSFADVLYLSSYTLVLPAILLGFSRTVRSRPLRSLLDTSIVVVAIAYVGWVALIQPQTSWGLSLATATGIAYPLLGVAILMLLAGVGLGVRAIPISFVLVAVGFPLLRTGGQRVHVPRRDPRIRSRLLAERRLAGRSGAAVPGCRARRFVARLRRARRCFGAMSGSES